MLILFATFGSLFTTLLGFSRVLYAAAVDGQFFSLFARLHPTRRFPSGSVLALGAMSSVLCVLPLETLLKAASGIAALTQYIPQTIAVLVIRRYRSHIALPFRMWIYPVPAWVALGGWFFVLLANERWIVMTALALGASGAAVYLFRAYQQHWWPFGDPASNCGTHSKPKEAD
jgi:amino acid transporter